MSLSGLHLCGVFGETEEGTKPSNLDADLLSRALQLLWEKENRGGFGKLSGAGLCGWPGSPRGTCGVPHARHSPARHTGLGGERFFSLPFTAVVPCVVWIEPGRAEPPPATQTGGVCWFSELPVPGLGSRGDRAAPASPSASPCLASTLLLGCFLEENEILVTQRPT